MIKVFMNDSNDLKERFFTRFVISKNNECWNWKGTIHKYGYGMISNNGKMELAHRLSWRLFRGKIPEGTSVIHRCDNRSCVNPNHLKLVLRKNINISRKYKLTYEIAEEIRYRYCNSNISQIKLAKMFGVSQKEISDIINRKCWT